MLSMKTFDNSEKTTRLMTLPQLHNEQLHAIEYLKLHFVDQICYSIHRRDTPDSFSPWATVYWWSADEK
jgi:hypothetical protein